MREYFNFSRKERNGIFVLIVLILSFVFWDVFYPIRNRPVQYDFSKLDKQIAEFDEMIAELKAAEEKSKAFDFTDVDRTIAETELSPFPFDPNTLSKKGWLKLGLPAKTVNTIMNYRMKGGKFFDKQDLEKIYGLTPSEFEVLEPYIRLKEITPKRDNAFYANEISPVDFDPNKIDRKQLLEMNLREKLVNTILNYRNSGGKFFDSDDLEKIYGMSDEEFAVLEPHIKIEPVYDTVVDTVNRNFYSKNLLRLDLNNADTLDLQQLRGIGQKYAQMIVKYRSLLGGYHSTEQLLEVYGMDSSRFNRIRENIFVTTDSIRKIDVNKASIKEFIRHPYIEYYLARSIVLYRHNNGNFESLEDIVNAHLIYQEVFDKLKPYLVIKNDNFED